jgi:hypothetical protein
MVPIHARRQERRELVSADLFHEATQKKYGGRLDTRTLPGQWPSAFEFIRKQAEEIIASAISSHSESSHSKFPPLPPIHFDFAASNAPQPFAALCRGQHIIGFTRGLVQGIFLLFERMLSDRRILPQIGNPAKEADHPQLIMPLGALDTPILSALWQDYMASGERIPSDKTRNEYCSWLLKWAFCFVLFHELAHIINGHVGWIKKPKHKSGFVLEFGMLPKTKREAVERHTLEVDADGWATTYCIHQIGKESQNSSETQRFNGYNTHLFTWFFATFSFMKLFRDFPPSKLYKSTHPPFRLRVGYTWQCALTQAMAQHGKTFDEIQKPFTDAARATDLAFHFLTGSPMPKSPAWYIDVFSPDGIDHWNRIANCWNKRLRQELLSHCYDMLRDPLPLVDK